jgi:hypothetical protein
MESFKIFQNYINVCLLGNEVIILFVFLNAFYWFGLIEMGSLVSVSRRRIPIFLPRIASEIPLCIGLQIKAEERGNSFPTQII